FDRVAGEVLGLPGDTPDERRDAARAEAPPALVELFEEKLPAIAAEIAAGRKGLGEGVSLYHMLLEAQPSRELLEELLSRAEDAAEVWGDVVSAAMRRACAQRVMHRLHVSGL